ncbi:MAG TPA: hypothetical protein VM186_12105 [Planctomycetota bacterium]|nr:hypothetical protein [Planctomycetota bacterium]
MLPLSQLKQAAASRMIPCIAGCILAALGGGCSSTNRVEGVFTRPALGTYQRMTVTGLQPDEEQIVMAEFSRAFRDQQVTFVERERVQWVFEEQDRLPDRLDPATRDKLRKLASVQGIIFGSYVTRSQSAPKGTRVVQDLRIRILDVESGEIVGSAVVHWESKKGLRMRSLTDKVVSAIKSSLMSQVAMRSQPTEAPMQPMGAPWGMRNDE